MTIGTTIECVKLSCTCTCTCSIKCTYVQYDTHVHTFMNTLIVVSLFFFSLQTVKLISLAPTENLLPILKLVSVFQKSSSSENQPVMNSHGMDSTHVHTCTLWE